MKDFPAFTTDNGVGSLILREVPYKKEAYLVVGDASSLLDFLKECGEFARAVGAEHFFVSGKGDFSELPFYTEVVRMVGSFPEKYYPACCLFPVTAQTEKLWREYYNCHMKDIPTSCYLTEEQMHKMAESGECYFIHENKKLIGLGSFCDNEIQSLISLVPGKGTEVLYTLADVINEETVTLTVASENKRAMSFYRKLGFLQTEVIASWYQFY